MAEKTEAFDTLTTKIKQYEQEIVRLRGELEQKNSDIERLKEENKNVTERAINIESELNLVRKTIETIKEERDKAKSNIAELRVRHADEISRFKLEMEGIVSELNTKRREYNALKGISDRNDTTIAEAKRQKALSDDKIRDLEDQNRSIIAARAIAEQELLKLNTEKQEISRKIDENLKTYESNIGRMRINIAEQIQKLKMLDAEKEKLEKDNTKLHGDVRECINQKDVTTARMSELAKANNELRNNIEQIRQELARLQSVRQPP